MTLAEEVAPGQGGGEEPLPALEALQALTRRPAWHVRARCRGYGPHAFFDEPELAVAVCSRCPVTAECEEAGGTQDGIWGGLTQAQRRRRRRKRRRATPA